MIILNFYIVLFINPGFSFLIQRSECVCPGYRVTFECSVMGSGITVWQGSAFNCPNSGGGISLRHSQYANRTVHKECKDGNVIAHSIGIVENNYISELSLNVSMDMNNKTIECVHDNGTILKLIGTSTVNITSDPFPPPSELYLANGSSRQLNFSWTPVSRNCSSIQYIIDANGCGECPTSTPETFLACTIDNPSEDVCTFNVQSAVCGSIKSCHSKPVTVTPIGPPAPDIISLPLNSKKNILTILGTTDSATSYTISYTDTSSGDLCDSVKIIATDCTGLCNHTFDISKSSCKGSSNVSVNVFATNYFGDGPLKETFTTLSVTQNERSTTNPFCNDDHFTAFISSTTVLMAVLIAVIVMSIMAIIVLIRGKAKLQSELAQLKTNDRQTFYEDIDLYQPKINTDDNLAYGHNNK